MLRTPSLLQAWLGAGLCLLLTAPASPLENKLPLQEIFARGLKAAQQQDVATITSVEESLGPVNEAIFRVFGRDVQGGMKRATAMKKQDVMVRVMVGQILLSIRLLLWESRSMQDPRSVHARLQQCLLNYRVVEKTLTLMAPAMASKLTDAFGNLETALAIDVKTAGPAAAAIEQVLAASIDGAKASTAAAED